ncbi:MAG: type II toxin-antitoxin system HicB family antitoxin [Bacteroidota bacterium]|nr:type II toxin-antitoxin system HicB family antitoxin [Bacteroidota bacterium]
MENNLQYKEYIGTVDFSAEDEVFYGKVHGINDLVTFEGQSVQELKKAFKESVDDYLETCAQLKKDPNKTFKGSLNVRLSPELHQKAAVIASRKSITLNDFIKKAVSYAINHESQIVKEG